MPWFLNLICLPTTSSLPFSVFSNTLLLPPSYFHLLLAYCLIPHCITCLHFVSCAGFCNLMTSISFTGFVCSNDLTGLPQFIMPLLFIRNITISSNIITCLDFSLILLHKCVSPNHQVKEHLYIYPLIISYGVPTPLLFVLFPLSTRSLSLAQNGFSCLIS